MQNKRNTNSFRNQHQNLLGWGLGPPAHLLLRHRTWRTARFVQHLSHPAFNGRDNTWGGETSRECCPTWGQHAHHHHVASILGTWKILDSKCKGSKQLPGEAGERSLFLNWGIHMLYMILGRKIFCFMGGFLFLTVPLTPAKIFMMFPSIWMLPRNYLPTYGISLPTSHQV